MSILIAGAGIDAIMASVIIYAVKKVAETSYKSMRNHCDDVSSSIKKVNDEQWSVINTHGHKALDANGSKVTR